jgi:hypothetical protein
MPAPSQLKAGSLGGGWSGWAQLGWGALGVEQLYSLRVYPICAHIDRLGVEGDQIPKPQPPSP